MRFAMRPSAGQIAFSGIDRVLIVAPHPDDETLGCGGTIFRHAEAGDTVHILIVTDGGQSRAYDLSRDNMVRLRASEAKQAVATLHIEARLKLGQLQEGSWETNELAAILSAHLHTLRPTIIYAPSCVDFHPEHLRVASCLAAALASDTEETERLIRVYELQVPLSIPLINRYVSIGPGLSRKRAALAHYRTQRAAFSWRARQERYLKALFGSRGAIEVFWEMSARGYINLMTCETTSRGRFRSMRPRPLTDGLAWLVGTRSRQRFRDMTDDSGIGKEEVPI